MMFAVAVSYLPRRPIPAPRTPHSAFAICRYSLSTPTTAVWFPSGSCGPMRPSHLRTFTLSHFRTFTPVTLERRRPGHQADELDEEALVRPRQHHHADRDDQRPGGDGERRQVAVP